MGKKTSIPTEGWGQINYIHVFFMELDKNWIVPKDTIHIKFYLCIFPLAAEMGNKGSRTDTQIYKRFQQKTILLLRTDANGSPSLADQALW